MACPCHLHSSAAQPLFPSCAPVDLATQARLGPVRSPERVYALLGERAGRLKNERAWILLLDPQYRLVVESEIGRGSERAVTVDLDWALACARSPSRTPFAILAHNHPSGNAWPSWQDARLTADMGAAAQRAGVELIDHVVLGKGEVFSFHFRRGFRL